MTGNITLYGMHGLKTVVNGKNSTDIAATGLRWLLK